MENLVPMVTIFLVGFFGGAGLFMPLWLREMSDRKKTVRELMSV